MKLYLHAGTHKTGTTSVQLWLDQNRDILAEHDILYPKLKSIVYQHSQFLNEYNTHYQLDDEHVFQEQLASKPWKSIILSGEVVSVLNREALRRLAGRFKGFSVCPILVLREWPGYLYSRWKQDVRRRDSWTFKSYIAKLEEMNFEHYDCSLDLVCENLSDSFQQLPILIGYEAAIERENSVLPAILRSMEIPGQLLNQLDEVVRRNITPSNLVIERNRIANLIYCNKNSLPEIGLFYMRPISRKPIAKLDFLPRIKRSVIKKPSLWSNIDNIIIGTENRFSLEHLKQPYHQWHTEFIENYGSSFFEGLQLKSMEQLEHWEQDIFETRLDNFPEELLERLSAELEI